MKIAICRTLFLAVVLAGITVAASAQRRYAVEKPTRPAAMTVRSTT